MLVSMPCFCRISLALMPSQVEAICSKALASNSVHVNSCWCHKTASCCLILPPLGKAGSSRVHLDVDALGLRVKPLFCVQIDKSQGLAQIESFRLESVRRSGIDPSTKSAAGRGTHLVDSLLGVVRQVSVHLGADSAGDDAQQFQPHVHGQHICNKGIWPARSQCAVTKNARVSRKGGTSIGPKYLLASSDGPSSTAIASAHNTASHSNGTALISSLAFEPNETKLTCQKMLVLWDLDCLVQEAAAAGNEV